MYPGLLLIPFNYPHAFSKKRRGYCNRLRLSVPPTRHLLNHWTKSNQIWCVSCSHEWGVHQHIFLALPPGALGRGKRSNIIKYQLQSQFQRFLNQTLCVFSQMKDIKHIRQDYHLAAWVMPKGWDVGVPWEVQIFWGEIQSDLVCELLTWMACAKGKY